MSAMQDIQSALMGQAVDDSPEVTPQDLQRQQLLKVLYERAGVPPEVSAKQTYDQMMGRDQTGVKGLLMRALAGAGEGIRQYNDPKYPGLYQSLVQQKEQQFKDTVPLLRSYEDSATRRDVARSKSRDAAVNALAGIQKNLDTIKSKESLLDAQTQERLAQARKHAASAELLQKQGKFTEAKTEMEKAQTLMVEQTGRKEATPEMANAKAFSGSEKNFLNTPASELFSGLQAASVAKATPNLIMKALTGGGRTSTSVSSKPERFIGEDNTVQTIYGPPTVRTTTSGGGGNVSPEAMQNVIRSFTPGGAAPATPAANLPERVKSPQAYTQSLQQNLGVKPTKPAIAPAPSNTFRLPIGYTEKDKKAVDQANSIAGEGLAAMNLLFNNPKELQQMGYYFGSRKTIADVLSDPNIKAAPAMKSIPTLMTSMLNRIEFIERFQFSGKQVNEAEIKQIKAMIPTMQDNYEQAVTKMLDVNLRTTALLANLYNKLDDESYRKFREAAPDILLRLESRVKKGQKVNELAIQEEMLPYLRPEAKTKLREQLKEEGRKRLKNAK